MQISFVNRFEDWIAAQVFGVEQLSSLKKYDHKKFIHMTLCLLGVDIFLFITVGANDVFKVFTFFIVLSVFFYLVQSRTRTRKLIYQRLMIACGQLFEEEKDKTVQWEAAPDELVIREQNRELRLKTDGIRKIVICPQYLFVSSGMSKYAYLPRRAAAEAEYNAFCSYLIERYQACAKQHGKEAVVDLSDWTIDASLLCQKVSPGSTVRRVLLTLVWGMAFLIVGVLFWGMLTIAVMVFQTSTGLLPCGKETFLRFTMGGLMIGTALFGIAGIILGLFRKLPGTK